MKNVLSPVVILAGGLATRLRPVTETVPKALLPIRGEPFIFHQLRALKQQGVSRVVLCVGYLGEQIETAVGEGEAFGLKVDYAYDGDTLLGTGGAIAQALPLLDEQFFILYGDSYLQCDYAAIQAAFNQSDKLALMTVFKNEGLWDSSNVEFQNGELITYSKRFKTPRMAYIDYGLGLVKASVFEHISLQQPTDLADIYETLVQQHALMGYEVKHRFYEVGSFAGIEAFEAHLAMV